MTELPENICRYGKKNHSIRISASQNPHGYVEYAKKNLQLINKKSNNPLKHGQTLIQTLDKKNPTKQKTKNKTLICKQQRITRKMLNSSITREMQHQLSPE